MKHFIRLLVGAGTTTEQIPFKDKFNEACHENFSKILGDLVSRTKRQNREEVTKEVHKQHPVDDCTR